MGNRVLTILEDVPGERLVLGLPGRPPPGERLRDGWRQGSDFLRRELAEALRSPRHFLSALGGVLLLFLLGALLLVAGYLLVVALGLIVVLFEIGVWMVAWWFVREAARFVVTGRRRSPGSSGNLRRLSFHQDEQEMLWMTAFGARTVPFPEIEGLRLRINTNPGKNCELVLEVLALGERDTLRFSVADLDREEEGADLCFRVARILRWPAYSAERHRLQGLEISLAPSLRAGETAHPFRVYAGEQERHTVPARGGFVQDWSVALAPGFQEPETPLPSFAPPGVTTGPFVVRTWTPGSRVELAAEPVFRPGRVLIGQLAAALTGGLLVAGVVALWLAVGGTLGPQPGGHKKSPGDVFAWLTAVSCGVGFFMTLPLWWKRVGRVEASFLWGERALVVRDDEGVRSVAFGEIEQIVLREVGSAERRYFLEAQATDRPPLRLHESPPCRGEEGHLPALSMAVDLARSLGVPWRCVPAPRA